MQQQLLVGMVSSCSVVGVTHQALPWEMHMALPGTEMGAGSGMQPLAQCLQGDTSMVQCLWATGSTSQEALWGVAAW
jgi:hypothetical protein